MDLQNIEWADLGFDYKETPYRYRSYWEDGEWDEGSLVSDKNITISESAPALHYGQQCFEGMKAQRNQSGDVLLFRPEENAKRLQKSASRLAMPTVSKEKFLAAIKETVKANEEYVPPYGEGAALYIRPLLIGIGDNLGLRPARKYLFTIFVVPVGPYFKEGFKPVKMKIDTRYDRSSPRGMGDSKVGANYAAGLLPQQEAKEEGYNEVIYMDAIEHEYFEEAGGANLIFIMKDGSLATPKSEAILPSITRRSVVELASKEFDLNVEHRKIHVDEITDMEEAGACGTAAVITPIGTINYQGKDYNFYGNGQKPGPVTTKLYEYLTKLQRGEKEDPRNWVEQIEL